MKTRPKIKHLETDRRADTSSTSRRKIAALSAFALSFASAAHAQMTAPQAPAPTPQMQAPQMQAAQAQASVVLAPISQPLQSPPGFLFHNGDRPVAILGDSITEQRMYSTLVEAYVLSRFPNWNISFRNIGWSGDGAGLWTRGGLDNGLKRDILPLKPASITIDYGMNDARGGDGNYDSYIANQTRLVDELKAIGSRVALVSPSPEEKYEPNQPGGSEYNRMLAKYSQGLKELAAREGVPYVDQYTPFVQAIESGRRAGILAPDGSGARLIPDGVHPNWAGHLIMAASILKGLNAPSLVSRVQIDAAKNTAQAQNASVSMMPAKSLPQGTTPPLVAPDYAIGFTRLDNALPWPIPDDASIALKIPGFAPLGDLDRYELQVMNLQGSSYDVLIDDQKAGSFKREELARGVNLATSAGPINAQGRKLFDAIWAKNSVYFERWRNVQIYQAPAWMNAADVETPRKAELARLDAQIADAENGINALRRPVAHVWKLVPTPPQAPAEVHLAPTPAGMKLSWRDVSDDESGFVLEKSTDGLAFTPLATLPANASSFQDTTATTSAPVYYRVCSWNNLARSGWTTASNAWAGTGLKGDYFGDITLTKPVLTRTDAQVDFLWDKVAPDARVSRENISVRWSGQVQPKNSDVYTFHVTSDDGVRLWVNGQKLIDQWMQQGATETIGQIALQANRKYPIRLEYYQGVGGAQVNLMWSSPSQLREVIPQSQLYPAP